jgi:hypothetical protein
LAFSLLFGWLLLVRMRAALNERKARALQLSVAPQRRTAAKTEAVPAGSTVGDAA